MKAVHDATCEVLRSFGMRMVFGNPGSNKPTFLDAFPADFRQALALQGGADLAMADPYSQAKGGPVLACLHAAAGVETAATPSGRFRYQRYATEVASAV